LYPSSENPQQGLHHSKRPLQSSE